MKQLSIAQTNKKSKRPPRPSQSVFLVKTLLNVLSSGLPLSQPQIINRSGLCNSTVSKYLAILHSTPKLVYIAGWKRNGERGNWQALWQAGILEDALKPKPLGAAAYAKRWRANVANRATIIETEKGIKHVSQ